MDYVCDSSDNNEWHEPCSCSCTKFSSRSVWSAYWNLFLASGLTQKYQKCHLTCQITGPVISLSHRALVWPVNG